jgi:hypothetical protein
MHTPLPVRPRATITAAHTHRLRHGRVARWILGQRADGSVTAGALSLALRVVPHPDAEAHRDAYEDKHRADHEQRGEVERYPAATNLPVRRGRLAPAAAGEGGSQRVQRVDGHMRGYAGAGSSGLAIIAD